MPPTKKKTMKHRKTSSDGLPRSVYSSKSKSQSTTEPKLREVTIPSQNIPVNSDPSIVISKPTIKSEFQEVKIPTQKAPIRIPPLTPSNLEELWALWISDPRLPTRASRHAWAASRNIHPLRVDSWFRTRKAKAEKLGQPMADDAYQLLCVPPAASVTLEVKRELTTPVPSRACDSDTTVDSPSGNTPILTDVGYYPGKHATYMPPKSSITPTPSINPQPTVVDPYYARYSSSATRTLTSVTNYGQTTSHSSDLHSPASSLSIYDKAADSIFNNQGSVNQSSLPFEASRAASPADALVDPCLYLFCTPYTVAAPAIFRSSAAWMESKLTNVDNRFEDSGVNTSNYH